MCLVEGISGEDFLASLAIAEGGLSAKLAPTEVELVAALIKGELDGLESATLVRAVAEGLALTHATSAVEVVFGAEHWLLNEVRSHL